MTAQKRPVARPAYADPKTLRLAANVRIAGTEPADQEDFEASIAAHGVKSPLGVRVSPVDGITEVIFGQRRLAAALKAGLAAVPIHWDDTPDEAIRTVQLVENLQRSDMNPLDIAAAVWDMYNNEAGGSQVFIAEALGKPKAWVSKMMKLGADVPDSANTVARGLMMANHLTDAEMAYTLCQIEAISLPDAQRIGKEISGYIKASQKASAADATDGDRAELAKCILHTRGSLRTALKQLQAAADGTPQAEPAGTEGNGDGDAGEGANHGEPAAAPAYSPERDDYIMLAEILEHAAVKPQWLPRLQAMRAFVAGKLAATEPATA